MGRRTLPSPPLRGDGTPHEQEGGSCEGSLDSCPVPAVQEFPPRIRHGATVGRINREGVSGDPEEREPEERPPVHPLPGRNLGGRDHDPATEPLPLPVQLDRRLGERWQAAPGHAGEVRHVDLSRTWEGVPSVPGTGRALQYQQVRHNVALGRRHNVPDSIHLRANPSVHGLPPVGKQDAPLGVQGFYVAENDRLPSDSAGRAGLPRQGQLHGTVCAEPTRKASGRD